jgi:hypothetical protein
MTTPKVWRCPKGHLIQHEGWDPVCVVCGTKRVPSGCGVSYSAKATDEEIRDAKARERWRSSPPTH